MLLLRHIYECLKNHASKRAITLFLRHDMTYEMTTFSYVFRFYILSFSAHFLFLFLFT